MKQMQWFNKEYLKKLPLGTLVLLLLFIGALLFFVFIAHEVLQEKEEAFDNRIFHFVAVHFTGPEVTPLMKDVTYFASATFLQIAYAALVLVYFLQKHFRRAAEIGAVGLGGFLVNYAMKLSFHRIRPPHPLIGPLHNFTPT